MPRVGPKFFRKAFVYATTAALLGTGAGIKLAEAKAGGKPAREAAQIYREKAAPLGVAGAAGGVALAAVSELLPNGRPRRRGKKKEIFTG